MFYLSVFFFFNDTATTEIYTLSLHDALPISSGALYVRTPGMGNGRGDTCSCIRTRGDRKSTRLNSSHMSISYAVFCLKKKKKRIRLATPSLCGGQNQANSNSRRAAVCTAGTS